MSYDTRRAAGYHPTKAELETLKALTAEQRKPTDADRPPPSVFPGKKARPTPGQLDVFGKEVA